MSERTLGQIVAGTESTRWRVPAERAMAGSSRGEELHGGIGDDPNSVVNTAVQHHLREDRQVSGCGEEPRVSGHPAHGECVLVIDLAPLLPAAGRDSGWRDAVPERVGGAERRLVHPQRVEHVVGEELVQRLGRDRFNDHRQDVRAQIGVLVVLPRVEHQRGGQHKSPRLGRIVRQAKDVSPSR